MTFDTRDVHPGSLHCCLPGDRVDGHDLAPAAVAAGAVALLGERRLDVDVPQVRVGTGQARPAMAAAAASLWGHPARALRMVGVTGTNGKTTVTHLLGCVLEANGWPTGVLGTLSGPGTVGVSSTAGPSRRGGTGPPRPGTTPEAPLLQELLAGYRAQGRVAVAMEVSSHALVQHRVDAIYYQVAVFTNLSQDHLDYHGTMDSYFRAKAELFTAERAEVGVINADDAWGRRLLESAPVPTDSFSLTEARDLELGSGASRFSWQGCRVALGLGGAFNVANALAAAHAARQLGVPPATVAEGLSLAGTIPGRYERVDVGQPFSVVVDYAHTPAALEQVLGAARQEASGGRVLVVFGCGGDRDRAKRPRMGAVAAERSDLAVVTTDNPRSEDPAAIIAEVTAGVGRTGALVVEPDRAAAIKLALAAARPGDVVVVAGKGHETGQQTAAGRLHFDDREAVAEALGRLPEARK